MLNFRELFAQGVGRDPFPYQERLAQATSNRIFLNVPTGAGKTAAAFFAWLWQRRFADESVRSSTPRRLVYCLPMRVLVEQTRDVINEWLTRLRLHTEIRVAVLMGGEERDGWDLFPEREAILIGTQDMLLSRAMNRAYGMSRYRWPVHFALVNNDCHWVVDEVQLMGNGLASTTQLQAFRERFGTQGRASTLWMSATLEPEWLKTVDFDGQGLRIAVEEDDLRLSEELRKRVEASKPVHEASASADQPKELAAEILDRHRPATRTLIVVNTVKRAVELYRQIGRVKPAAGLELIHSRYRAPDRERALSRLLADPGPEGSIIVSTQVVEAGVDVSATTLFTEIAPWSSLVQRFGRCNRTGRDDGAKVYWIGPEKRVDLEKFAPPYDSADLRESLRVLRELKDGGPIALKDSSASMGFVHRHVLRRRDLEELFDTTPDLAGRDIDVSRFIRETDDLDVRVFWRGVADDGQDLDEFAPERGELCAAPIGEVRELVGKGVAAWVWDGLLEKWRRVNQREIYPGMTLMLKADEGHYTEDFGWNAKSAAPVNPVEHEGDTPEANGDDRWAKTDWMSLAKHTDEVVNTAREIADASGLPAELRESLLDGARWHDAGKAHDVFQNSVRRGDPDAPVGILAKTPHRIRHSRPGFRHELASGVLALMNGRSDLAAYLAAAHHGKVRLSIRSMPNERKPPEPSPRFARGIYDGELIQEADLGGSVILPATAIDLSYMELGGSSLRGSSWLARMLSLRDRPDLGPFRLAFLEALIKAADERASGAKR